MGKLREGNAQEHTSG